MLRLALLVLSPTLLLLLIEGLLWLSSYGRSTEFLVEWSAPSGETFLVTNNDFCLQFVPEELSRRPEALLLGAKGNETRIFVLGGSAAAGDPDSIYGFSRVLEAVLNRGKTTRRYEVVNAAVTAMGSHVVRHIAADCTDAGADALVVYMGNNEVVGPYGPAATPGALYGSAWMIRSMIAVKGTRTSQLMAELARGDKRAKTWMGMEAFLEQQVALDDPRLADCYDHFKSNLDDILCDADDAGAGVVLCTVPVNIRSCAPFGSAHRAGLGDEQLARWTALYEAGRQACKEGDFAGALNTFRQAAEIDDAHAELIFASARCAEETGELAAARDYYARARDLDTLRFRADSRIDEIIRDMARLADGRVALADLAGALADEAEQGVPGSDLLVDHVHLNFRANVLAAVAAAKALRRVLPDLSLDLGQGPTAIYELQAALRRQLGYDARAEYDVAVEMYVRKLRPPFEGQLDHEAETDALRARLINLRKIATLVDVDHAEREYLAAAAAAPFDPLPDRALGLLWLRNDKAARAVERHRGRLNDHPHCAITRRALAYALAIDDKVDEAVEILTSPDNPFDCGEVEALAFVAARLTEHGGSGAALEVNQRILKLDARHIDALINLGAAADEQGRFQQGEQYLKRALEVDPEHSSAMVNLANTYVGREMFDEARRWFEKAVETNPYSHMAHLGLGLQLLRDKCPVEGLEHIELATKLNPTFVPTYGVLAGLYELAGQRERAMHCARMARLFSGN
ncbi:MAG: tetratricopeptide repeat protein [Candidatus Nealsonbacteria bacterium]|nr:tetratricopeptide repeat protein [Candidatus Nealsonbacteria bacterium]